MWVSPFRNPRVYGYVLLSAAYRSLSRLSSALSAKASTLRSSSLNLSFSMHSVAWPGLVIFSWLLLFLYMHYHIYLCEYIFYIYLYIPRMSSLNIDSFFLYSVFKVRSTGLPVIKIQKAISEFSSRINRYFFNESGSHLLSHTVSSIVSSAA